MSSRSLTRTTSSSLKVGVGVVPVLSGHDDSSCCPPQSLQGGGGPLGLVGGFLLLLPFEPLDDDDDEVDEDDDGEGGLPACERNAVAPAVVCCSKGMRGTAF